MGLTVNEAAFEDSARLGASEAIASSPWVVMKFGGSSVSSKDDWQTIAALVQNRLDEGLRPVLVHSALQGISNALSAVFDFTTERDSGAALAGVRERHYRLAAELGLDGPEAEDRGAGSFGDGDDRAHGCSGVLVAVCSFRRVTRRRPPQHMCRHADGGLPMAGPTPDQRPRPSRPAC